MEEDKSKIQEIIDIATEIDLWNMDLPPIPKTRGSKEDFDPFTIECILRNFVSIFNNTLNTQPYENKQPLFGSVGFVGIVQYSGLCR